jgi:adenylate cyclase
MIDTLSDWLIESGLGGADLRELLGGLCRRLNADGIAVERGGCAVLRLHPQIFSEEVSWLKETDATATAYFTPNMMLDPDNRRGPYFDLALNGLDYNCYRLASKETPDTGGDLLARLKREGYTEYFGFCHQTGGIVSITPFARALGLTPCVAGSFATRRRGGFAEGEIECFKALSRPLALAARSWANYDTASHFLNLYIGRSCGARVLDGRITRGDSERIICGIWFPDLRESSRLVSDLRPNDYLALLNRYFDATAGAVMAEGGEVLKFIGDAVLGIFA